MSGRQVGRVDTPAPRGRRGLRAAGVRACTPTDRPRHRARENMPRHSTQLIYTPGVGRGGGRGGVGAPAPLTQSNSRKHWPSGTRRNGRTRPQGTPEAPRCPPPTAARGGTSGHVPIQSNPLSVTRNQSPTVVPRRIRISGGAAAIYTKHTMRVTCCRAVHEMVGRLPQPIDGQADETGQRRQSCTLRVRRRQPGRSGAFRVHKKEPFRSLPSHTRTDAWGRAGRVRLSRKRTRSTCDQWRESFGCACLSRTPSITGALRTVRPGRTRGHSTQAD